MTEPFEKPKPEKPAKKAPAEKTETPADRPEGERLTPEEQMARFEKELKEQDWGHQPC